jgi:hypothetical protein
MKLLTIALSGAGHGGGDLAKTQCKPTQNSHYESPTYNEYILLKK